MPGTLSHVHECMRHLRAVKLIGAQPVGCQPGLGAQDTRGLRGFRIVTESLGMTCEGVTRGSIKGVEKRTQDGTLRDFSAE